MCFKIFKRISCQIKCDKKLTEKYNWVFLGSRTQKLKPNKFLLVEPNQICFLRCRDKTCDVFEAGKYKISEDVMPKLYKRLNIKEVNKHTKLKTHVYYYKTNITYTFNFKKQSKLKNLKIKEKISAQLTYEIADLMLHTKYIFLEDARVDNNEYYSNIYNLIDNYFTKLVKNYNGEFYDLTDEEITLSFKAKLEKELSSYGLTVTELVFNNYQDLTKYKKQKNTNKVSLSNNCNNPQKAANTQATESTEPELIIVDYRDKEKNKNINYEQNIKTNQSNQTNITSPQENFSSVVTSGRIVVNPEE